MRQQPARRPHQWPAAGAADASILRVNNDTVLHEVLHHPHDPCDSPPRNSPIAASHARLTTPRLTLRDRGGGRHLRRDTPARRQHRQQRRQHQVVTVFAKEHRVDDHQAQREANRPPHHPAGARSLAQLPYAPCPATSASNARGQNGWVSVMAAYQATNNTASAHNKVVGRSRRGGGNNDSVARVSKAR